MSSQNLRGSITTFLVLLAFSIQPAGATEPAQALPTTAPAIESASAAVVDPPVKRHKYIRITRDASDRPLSLQTSIVQFGPASKSAEQLQVDLIGAVHVGEKSYYETLNKLFEQYDVVLYELVAPEGTRVPKGGRPSGHPVAMLQTGLKEMLALEHQLEQIDYSKTNLLHADMSPEDFAKSMEDRDESFFSMFARMWGQALAQQASQKSGTSDFDVLTALFSKDRSHNLKRVMAEQFENIEGVMQALEGPEGSTIITERNKVALSKLTDQIAAGKKKIAIFYGAGHLGDMEQRLNDSYQLQRVDETWLDAWFLSPSSDAPAAKPAPAEPTKKAA